MKSFILLALAAASAPPGANLSAPSPVFVPERFFVGRTEGNGTLKVVLKSAQATHVRGNGRMEGDILVLDQVVERPGEPPQRRQWRFKRQSGGVLSGTLSDAQGPVKGDISGNRMHLLYKLAKDHVDVEQWIYLQPDGRTALNRMVLHRFGFSVGTMQETIRRLD